MSYSATVFRIMIASPGDVSKERDATVEAMLDWNSNHAESTALILQPLRWEIDAPLGIAENAQELIDEHLIEKSDLVIGIFRSTLGRVDETDISYTIGELQKHIQKGKQVILFFGKPCNFKTSAEAKKVQQVLEFKENIKKQLGQSALYCDYKSLTDFKYQISSRMDRVVQTHLLNNVLKSQTKPLFSDVTMDRATLQAKIEQAKYSVFISGPTLITITTTPIKNCIKNGVQQMRFLMIENNQSCVEKSALLDVINAETQRDHLLSVLKHFSTTEPTSEMFIHSVNAVMSVGLVGIDIETPNGIIYVTQYLYRTAPGDAPHYACYAGEEPFEIYKQQIEALWQDSKPVVF